MSKASPIQVLIVDDHDMLREGLAAFLRAYPDLKRVGEAATGGEAIRLCRALRPDVVLMDLMMPERDGVAAIQAIHQELPEIRIIVLSSFGDDPMVRSALRAGATGYLLKRLEPDELLQASRDVHVGGSPMSNSIARKVVASFQQADAAGKKQNLLSAREQAVLDCLAQGLAYKQIGDQLGISINTIRSHLRHIYEKLHVQSRTEAVAKYLRL